MWARWRLASELAMRKALVTLAALFLFAPTSTAWAGKKEGVTMPDTIEVAGKKLVLNGMGLRAKAIFDVYVAGLYLETKTHSADTVIQSKQVKRIHIEFKRDVDNDKIVEAWQDGFQKNAGKNFESLRGELLQLCSWMPDFKEGQTLTFTYVPSTGLTVAVNGKNKGTIKGDAFAQVMFAVFVGKAPSKDLKQGLLAIDD
jgi:hypothetical protein